MTTPSEPADWRARHGEDVAAALEGGDPTAIKRLYVDLGTLLEESYGADDQAPQLSRDETVPVVTSLLRDVGGRILDAGCGPYPVASIALSRERPSRSLVALDLGHGTVRLARAAAARAGIEVLAVVGDLEDLPFRGGIFEGIVCDDTIEHVPDDRRGVAELVRVTAPAGAVVIATPNRWSLAILRAKLRDRVRRQRRPASAYFVAESHLREYTWRELMQLVRPEAQVSGRGTVGWEGGRKARLASVLVGVPGLRTLDQMLVVRLRAP